MKQNANWVVCQLGAREHYAIPRALDSFGALESLFTEAWVPPGNPWGFIRRNLRERFHTDIPKDRVNSSSLRTVGFELKTRLRNAHGWDSIILRNSWFQDRVVEWLEKTKPQRNVSGGRGTLFSFSYTARRPFKWAKKNGWKTVLGQIDGAIGDEKKIAQIYDQHSEKVGRFHRAPAVYWNDWREECVLADAIIVNSEWSRELLMQEGVGSEKISIVPLAYSPPLESCSFVRNYPEKFNEKRPLRLLFIGKVSVRKGVIELLQAIRMLGGRSVELWIVGPNSLNLPQELREQSQVRWIGAVPRGKVAEYYRKADIMIFATHSDGFGLTQLEAQAWKLPIIASNFCGRVVEHQVNGLELPEVSVETVAYAIETCLDNPEKLSAWSGGSLDLSSYGIDRLAEQLQSLK